MENENLFKEIQAYPELNSPLNLFPIINHDMEKYNSKYRNIENSEKCWGRILKNLLANRLN